MSEAVRWRVDPLESRTLRWLVCGQIALVDAGLALAAVGLLAGFALAIELGSLAAAVAVILLGVTRGVAWAGSDRWRPDGAAGRIPRGDLLRAIAAGVAFYLGVFALAGVGVALAVAALAFLVTGWLLSPISDGVAIGEVDPRSDRLTFAGRSRPSSSVTHCSRYAVGDLAFVRCRGPAGLDAPRWLTVHAADADRVVGAIARAGAERGDADGAECGVGGPTGARRSADARRPVGARRSAGDRPAANDRRVTSDERPASDWRRLQAPAVGLAALAAVTAPAAAFAAGMLDGPASLAAVALVVGSLGALLAILLVRVRPSRIRLT